MSGQEADREHDVTRAFVALADTLAADYDPIDLLDRLTTFSVELSAADAAGIILAGPRGETQVVAASDEHAELTEQLQLQTRQGPCLDCFATATPVNVTDLAQSAPRWPTLVPPLRERTPFRTVHALPLRLRDESIGAVNLFRRQPGPLPTADLHLTQALADVATIGILQERTIRRSETVRKQLQGALSSRVIIEQAKGVIAARSDLTMGAAFELLRGYSRGHNLRLADVARELVEHRLDPNMLIDANKRK
ncbi:MAG TPA: GAF and ANTAR domain-containing protein [Pseudonocardia sp.]|nr:GAF and ANTAR domain-containing protein [Pseudonocardia sp.]